MGCPRTPAALRRIGECTNAACVNSINYPVDYFNDEARSKIEEARQKLTGCIYGVHCCPHCRQWTVQVLDDSAPGGFFARCINETCKEEFVIDRT